MGLGDELVVRALAIGFYARESPGRAVVQFFNALARACQRSVLVGIRCEGARWMHQRQQREQSDGRLDRPKDTIRPSDVWIIGKLAAVRERYEATKEGHIIYVYRQSSYRASQGDGCDSGKCVEAIRAGISRAIRRHCGCHRAARITG